MKESHLNEPPHHHLRVELPCAPQCAAPAQRDPVELKSKHPLYRAWIAMMTRCHLRPRVRAIFPYWGGRGITVCQRWRTFENFVADMGPRPTPKHSLDRVDNSAGYEPSNCRWATSYEQRRNQRNSVFVELNGQPVTLGEFSRLTGICANTIYKRAELLRARGLLLNADALINFASIERAPNGQWKAVMLR